MRTGPDSIAIIGLGFMGGSLAAACRRKFPKSRIFGISRNRAALSFARRKGWIHEASRDLGLASRAQLVILCTPVDTFPKILSRLEKRARSPLLVTDMGSVKGAVMDFVRHRRWKKVKFVGAHPMAGSHECGFHAARADVYDGAFTFVVRGKGADPAAHRSVRTFWKKITPRIIELNESDHDRIVSEVSHLPHAVAACLVLSARGSSLRFAASGFRDATRIAQGHPSVWLPIFMANRKAVLRSLSAFEKNLARFRMALKDKNSGKLAQMLAPAAKKRGQI